MTIAMPDEQGRLSEADNDLIERWWSQHANDSVICPVCKRTSWMIAEHLINIQRDAADGSNTPTYPHVILTCESCAHSMFFNALQIGIAASPRRPAVPTTSDDVAHKGIVELTQSLADLINK